jgi:hypothetical protein
MTLTRTERLHHIVYEAKALVDMLKLGMPHEDVQLVTSKGNQTIPKHVMLNMVIEQRALHARNVIELFLNKNDIKAREILPENLAQSSIRTLEALMDRISTQVLHMTDERVPDSKGPAGKEWSEEDFAELVNVVKNFIAHVLEHSPTRRLLAQDDEPVCVQLSKDLQVLVGDANAPRVATGLHHSLALRLSQNPMM